MAEQDNSAGALFVELGLDISQLESDFIAADQTVQQNLNRLNRERNLIQLHAEVEIGNLDEAADQTQILAIRERALNQQLQIQRDRIQLTEAAHRQLVNTQGASATATQNMEARLQREQLALQRLEEQLRNVNEAQEELNNGGNVNGSDFGGLEELVDGVLSKIPPQAKMAAAGIGVLGAAFIAMNEATDKLIEKFKELQKTAYDFNLPIEKADEFARKIRLAGGELEDVGGYLRGLTDALIKGEIDDPEWIALQRYNETIFDATGKLKNYAEIWEAVHRAFQKAKAEGNEINFLQMTGGESGVTDAMQALQNWERAVKDAEKIIKAKIDYSQLDEATRQTNLLNEQFDEFGKQVAEIFSPAKTAMVENFFNVIRAGTDFLVKNRDALKSAFELPNAFTSPVAYQKGEEESLKRLAAEISNEANNLNKVFEASAGLEQAHADLRKRLADQSDTLTQYSMQRAMDLKDAIDDLRIEIDYDNEYQKALAQAKLEQKRASKFFAISGEERARIEEKYLADIEKAEKDHQDTLDDLWRETAAIRYGTTHSEFKKQIYDIDQWKKKAIEDLGEYKDAIDKSGWIKERDAIIANAAAKERQAIETERERIADITKETASIAYEATHSAFEKEIRDIEEWKKAQLEKASTAQEVQALIANTAEKEARAFESEMDRIKGNVKSLSERIFEQTHSQRDIDIMRAQKQRAEYLEQGNPASLVNEWYNNEIGKIAATKGRGYKKAPKISSNTNVPDFYGDIQRQSESYTPQIEKKLRDQMQAEGSLDDLSVKATDAAQALSQIPSAVQDFQKLSNLPVLQSPQIALPDLSPMYQQLQFNFDIFNTATNNASIALTELAVSTQNVTANLDNFFKGGTPANPAKTEIDNSTASAQNSDLSVTLQQLIQLQSQHLPQIEAAMQPLNQMTQQLADLSQTAGSIAQSVNNDKARTITIAPNVTVSPNINLGGAYVFDNQMKQRLTDDITSNVANAVTDAVNKATSNIGYGYGN